MAASPPAGPTRAAPTGGPPSQSLASTPAWQITVIAEALRLQQEFSRVDDAGRSGPIGRGVQEELIRAVRATGRDERTLFYPAYPDTPAARTPALRRLVAWWNGSQLETAWAALHVAGEQLLLIQPEAVVLAQLDDIDAAVLSNLGIGDARTADFHDFIVELAKRRTLTEASRERLRLIRHAANATSDAAHADARSYRNTLILIGAALSVTLVVIALAGVLDKNFRPLCANTSSGSPVGCGGQAKWNLFEVELIGSLGGLLAAVFALKSFSGFQSTYSLPFVQAFLRGASGAATGLIGVAALESGLLVSGTPQSTIRVFAYAALFGYSQELFTRVVNNQADSVLNATRSRNDPKKAPGGSLRQPKPS
jgi:hypothetical protein